MIQSLTSSMMLDTKLQLTWHKYIIIETKIKAMSHAYNKMSVPGQFRKI